MSTAPAQRLEGFDWLRCFAILAVVSIHVTDVALRKNHYFPQMTLEGAAYFATSAWFRFCVPVFFMMSAFLQETRMLAGGPRPAGRWRRYLFPLVVASVVYTVLNVATAKMMHKPVVPLDVLALALTGQAAVHTWFLMNALVYALVHHHLRRLASTAVFVPLAVAYSVLYAVTLGRAGFLGTSNAFGSALVSLVLSAFFYLSGIWAARNAAWIRSIPRSLPIVTVLIGLGLATFYGVVLEERTFYNPGTEVLSAGAFVWALGVQKPAPAFVRLLGTYSLGIYLWHLGFLLVARVAEGRYYREAVSPAVTFGIVVAEILVGLFGGLLVSIVLARSPRWSGLAR